MPIMRLILLLVVVIGLGVFAWQNWQPVLELNFLGGKTQTLPLAVWILGAIASGFFTSIIVQLLNNLSVASQQPNIKEPVSKQSRPNPQPPENPAGNQSSYADTSEDDIDDDVFDWEEEPSSKSQTESDWEDEEEPKPQDTVKSNIYEVRQQPKTATQSGSVYSYSYRESKDSGVGKTDRVYDADYRVITPPYKPPVEQQDDWTSKGDDDDWGFEDDEDFEDYIDNPTQR